ncbi:MAG: PCMD domain-containing protein [Candidatus Symbiothrix sp.]|jgi:hypothetical protein|nr:PCMD domain-containing protein [Candidatus Symbiothrix sp.]
MKRIIFFLSVLCLFSCERGPLLNSEADIIDVILPKEMLAGKPIITNTTVRIPALAVSNNDKVQLDEQLQHLAPQFVLSEGAKILDADAPRDFREPQQYTVVSEDGKWQKNYKVSFFESKFDAKFFDFSHSELVNNKYVEFYELMNDVKFNVWASGNAGFALTAGNAVSDLYPTFSTPNGKNGAGVKLVTRSTGSLGAMVKMPIAAGNLFLGNFEVGKAMTKPLEATQFGVQTTQNKPLKLGVWAKYKAGEVYKDKNGKVLQKKDAPNIYAVLYKAKINANGKPVKLNGTNILTGDTIVCIAVLSAEQADYIKVNNIESDPYKYIEIPFEERKPFDTEQQHSRSYYFAIVFSSGLNGDLFEGAVGSTLCIDEVEVFDN